jgi:hypothetical protein
MKGSAKNVNSDAEPLRQAPPWTKIATGARSPASFAEPDAER